MSDKLTTVLAHTVLAFSSGYSLSNTEFGFSTIGLSLYFATGVMGAVIYGARDIGGSIYKLLSNLWVLSIAFGLPSISSHLYVINNFPEAVIGLHFLLPVVFSINLYFFSKRTNFKLLESINLPYLLSIAYSCSQTMNYHGFALVISYVIALYAIGTTGTVRNMPSRDLLSISLVFSNYYTVKTINFRN